MGNSRPRWNDADCWVNRGVAFHRLGKTKKARRCFKTALELSPNDRRARSNLTLLDRE
jgi:Flp pilus assembly protein TadD